MKRREFVASLCSVTTLPFAWPVAALAQQAERMKRIGVLMGVADDAEGQGRLRAFVQGLQGSNWTDGRNVRFEIRWAAGDSDAIRNHATELAALNPDVIVAVTTAAFVAMQRLTQSIPIVFVQVVEPLSGGLVASLAHPGGNSTGFTSYEYATCGKWLATLKEVAPNVEHVAVIHNPDDPASAGYLREGEILARSLGVEFVPMGARTIVEVQRALDEFARKSNGGMIVLPSAFSAANREQLVALAASHHLPAVYPFRYFAVVGGLLTYGFDNIELYKRAASYVDRILRGAKPDDLPIQQPTRFELVINLKTAKVLGLTIPETFLVRADEVIE